MEQLQLMARLARLDADRVYMGMGDPIPVAEVQPGNFVFGDPALKAALESLAIDAVWVERGCDLASGKYRLTAPHDDHPHWHFMPVADELVQTFDQMVELGLAMALASFNTVGPIGRYAREYYALAAKNFPEILARHAEKASK